MRISRPLGVELPQLGDTASVQLTKPPETSSLKEGQEQSSLGRQHGPEGTALSHRVRRHLHQQGQTTGTWVGLTLVRGRRHHRHFGHRHRSKLSGQCRVHAVVLPI